MTIWDWIHGYELQARAARSLDGVRLCNLHGEAYAHRQDDPDRMFAVLEEGRLLALRMNEPWWAVFFEHWQLETLIYYKDDYREVVERAVRLTLEVRKPGFEGYPLRFGIYCNLVAAYLCVDPRGHAQSVREALAFLQTIVPEEGGDRYLLQARRHWFAYEVGDLEQAERLALEELSMADSDPDRHTAIHHEVDTYKALCWIAFRKKDWLSLEAHAAAGEERARDIGYRYELALFLLWRAVCARREGNEEAARRLSRLGTGTMSRLGQPPGESYYDALATFHELGGDLPAAWSVREQELVTTLGKGQLAYETSVHLKRVELLRRMGWASEGEAEKARTAAARLRDPSWYLAELARVTGG